jgi:predicted nucleic acid-binding protein
LIVPDASLIIALVLREANVDNADSVFEALRSDHVSVPAHWSAEVANALWVNRRRRRISTEQIATVIESLAAFDPNVADPPSLERIASLIQFAGEEKLTVYDAIYVQLALAQNATLGTIDMAMRASAKRLNIRLLPE